MDLGHTQLWRDLFVMMGGSAGTLVGLLFVVVSLHVDRIVGQADVNMRATVEGARNNTYHLLTVLVEAGLVLAPQPLALLGAELVAVNLFGVRLPLSILHRYLGRGVTLSERGGFPARLVATIVAAYLLGAAGGVALVFAQDWGVYLVAASCMIKLVRTVLTAWMLMFGMFHAQPAGGEGSA